MGEAIEQEPIEHHRHTCSPSGGLLLVGGRLADRSGPRRMFAVSLAGFAGASVMCGLAPASGVLVGARAVQGAFGALLSPSALALLLLVYTVAAGLLAMFFFQTLYLQRVLGFGPLKTGLSFLPFSAAMGVASAAMGRLPQGVDPRVPIAVGCGLATVGLWLMSGLTPTSAYGADVLPALLLAGLGLGLAFVPVIGLGTGDADERDGGLASGLMTTAQQIGGAIGIAALITIATSHTAGALRTGTGPASALITSNRSS